VKGGPPDPEYTRMDPEQSRRHWIELLDKLIWEEPADQLVQREPPLRGELFSVGIPIREIVGRLPSDETLALAIQKGFLLKESFEELFVNRYQRLLLYWSFRWHGKPELAREHIQQLFCRFLENRLCSFQPRRTFRAYLYQAALNLYLDHARRGNRGRSLESVPEPLADTLPEDEAAGKEMADRIEQALLRLSEPEQTILRLTMNGQTAEEISRELGLSKRRVFARLYEARRCMERDLQLPSQKRPRGRAADRRDSLID
jgi:RNA polymerase sigma factor (sigma-70 family)